MKNKIKSLMGIVFALSSCALESEIYDKVNPTLFPKNEADVKALVTANAYNVFASDQYEGIFAVATGYNTLSDVVTDQMEVSRAGDWVSMKYNSYESNEWYMYENLAEYRKFAPRLAAMILTLDRIESADIKMDASLKARYLAEVKCAMGFLSYLFYDLYGPVMLPDLETLKQPATDNILPRATEEEMRNFIETNLKEAANILPVEYPSAEYGRFTKGLANTLLLKFYMRIGDWDKAVKIGEKLVDDTEGVGYTYKLANDYLKLFSLAGEQDPEIIFAATAIDGGMENNWHAHFYYPDFVTTAGITKWGMFCMAWPFYQSYDPEDYRLGRVYGSFTDKDGVVHNYENDRLNGNISSALYYGAMAGKYDIKEGVMGEMSSIDLIIYRYADVMMLYGEAMVRKENKVTTKALKMLNDVRTTHGRLDAYPMSEVNSTEAYLAKMLEERGFEFFMEGGRRQDLLRHGKFIEKAIEKAEFAGQPTAKIATKVDGKYKYELFPLPEIFITEGKGVVVQNPGY